MSQPISSSKPSRSPRALLFLAAGGLVLLLTFGARVWLTSVPTKATVTAAPGVSPQPWPSPEGADPAATFPVLARTPSHWIALATPAALVGPLAGIRGDLREFAPADLDRFAEWLGSFWPANSGWRRMAWIDPQCPHCKQLVESGDVDRFAPRVIMQLRLAEARAAAGWLLADSPQIDRYLNFEPADPRLSQAAAERQGCPRSVPVGTAPRLEHCGSGPGLRGDSWRCCVVGR